MDSDSFFRLSSSYLLAFILPVDIVILDDVYRTEPWNLLGEYRRDTEGYLLSPVKAGTRRSQKAGEGSYIIQTHSDGEVSDVGIVWRKSEFNFQRREEGKTNKQRRSSGWVMTEYEITSTKSEWVLCRVKLSDREIAKRRKMEENAIVAFAGFSQEAESPGTSGCDQEMEKEIGDQGEEQHCLAESSEGLGLELGIDQGMGDGGWRTTRVPWESFLDIDAIEKLVGFW